MIRIQFLQNYCRAVRQEEPSAEDAAYRAGLEYWDAHVRASESPDPPSTSEELDYKPWSALMWRLSCLDDASMESVLGRLSAECEDEHCAFRYTTSVEKVREWRREYDLKQFTEPYFGPHNEL